MSYSPSDFEGICPATLVSLGMVAGNDNVGAGKIDPIGMTAFLRSPENMAVSRVQVDVGDGHKRTQRIKYLQRGIGNVSDANLCEGVQAGFIETTADIEYKKSVGVKLTQDYLSQLCSEYSQLVTSVGPNSPDLFARATTMPMFRMLSELLSAQLNDLFTAVNEVNLTQVAANWGVNAATGTNAAVTLNLLATADKTQRVDGFQKYKFQTKRSGLRRPAIIGFNEILDGFAEANALACCSNGGFDFSKTGTNPFTFYTDWQADAIFGTNVFAAIDPGAVQIIPFAKFAGRFGMNSPETKEMSVTLPALGSLPVSLKWYYDRCNNVWDMILEIEWGLFFLPNDQYQVGDTLAGTNGILRFTAATA